MSSRWIQEAIEKPGGLRNQLKRLGLIKGNQKIPLELLNKISKTPVGKSIYWKGVKFTVTELLKRRAVLAKTLRKLGRKKKRSKKKKASRRRKR